MNFIKLGTKDLVDNVVCDTFNVKLSDSEFSLIKKVPMGFEKQLNELIRLIFKHNSLGHINGQLCKTIEGNEIAIIQIFNEPKNSVLYEPLQKLGIFTNIDVGYDFKNKTLYLNTKLKDTLDKYQLGFQQGIIMYLITIINYLMLAKNKYDLSYDASVNRYYNGTVDFDEENMYKFLIKDCFPDFSQDTLDISIKNIVDLKFSTIKYISFNNTYYASTITTGNLSDSYKYIGVLQLDKTTNVEEVFILFYNQFKNGYYLKMTDSYYITNEELSYYDIYYNSVGSKLANLNNLKTIIQYSTSDTLEKLLNNANFLNQDDLEERVDKDTIDFLKDTGCEYFQDLKALNENFKFIKSNTMNNEIIINEYKDDEYAQKLYEQVLDYYKDFNLRDLNKCVLGFQKGDIYSLMLIGESGTGKSTAARVLAYRAGIPYISINLSANTEETDLFGTMIPNPSKVNEKDSEFIWKDGLITKAIRNGYVIILEEINFAKPSILGKLNSLLDETRQVELPNGELIKAHKNFRIIATCNIAYEGTNRFNKALINRFEIVKKFDDLDNIEISNIIKSRTKYTDDNNINKILQVYKSIKKFSESNNLDLVISIRQLLTLFKQYKYYKNIKEAILNTLIHNAFIEEPEYEEVYISEVLNAIDLNFKM